MKRSTTFTLVLLTALLVFSAYALLEREWLPKAWREWIPKKDEH